jgi:hypothetical protein
MTTSTTTTSEITSIDSKLINVTRGEWRARPPSGNIATHTIPVDTVIVTSTETIGCASQTVCIQRLIEIQNKQMDKQHAHDIVYNLLMSTEGQVYEGRGLDKVSECAAGGELNKRPLIPKNQLHICRFRQYQPLYGIHWNI